MAPPKKTRTFDAAIQAITKKYGQEDARDIIYDPKNAVLDSSSSGSIIIDCNTGTDGLLVRKKIVEIAAPESSGKTTLCLQSAAVAQKNGWVTLFVDNEQAFDYNYAKKLGLKCDNQTFLVVQPTYAEEAEELIDTILAKVEIDALMIDSIAAMKPENQIYADNSTGKGQVKGGHAMFWSNYSPKLQTLAKEGNFAVLMTNQVRRKLNMGGPYEVKAVGTSGIGTGFSTDDSWVTTGGEALKFYCSARYLLNFKKQFRIEKDDGSKMVIGNIIKIHNVKNKMTAPYAKSEFLIRFRGGCGTDDIPILIQFFKDQGLITATGGNYTLIGTEYLDEIKVKGYDNFEKELRKDKYRDGLKKLYQKCWEMLNDVDGDETENIEEDEDIDIEEDDVD